MAQLSCPRCKASDIDIARYESMIVITQEYALFTMHCPHCTARISSVCAIPEDMLEEVRYAAIEVGAGMGRQS